MDPDHPILPDARLYEVIALYWDRSGEEPFLELTLRHTEVRRSGGYAFVHRQIFTSARRSPRSIRVRDL